MKLAAMLTATLLLEACARTALPPSQLMGRWTMIGTVQGCTTISMEFTPDGHIRSISGQQVIDTKATYTQRKEGFIISLQMLSHNDMPNCQGISADFVVAHLVPFIYVTLNGATMHVSMLDESQASEGSTIDLQHDGT